MKKLLLLGDSIRGGYAMSVKASLEGKAEVVYPTDSGRFAAYTLRMISDVRNEFKENIDVIHWNAGLWDCLRQFEEEPNTPIEMYEYFIDRICQRMRMLFPESTIVFATSTKVLEERLNKKVFCRYNAEIDAYNEVAVKVVKKYGFFVDDLNAVSKELPKEAHSDGVHYYTSMGTKAFTMQVINSVKPHLGIEEDIEYKEVLHKSAVHGF
ncbi:MAG: SGNH/GDSL hydrolase family protein [Clostridia bacterium]|nr:SGNH/GDSL hydrolase family protein [Clostridia bacterium]